MTLEREIKHLKNIESYLVVINVLLLSFFIAYPLGVWLGDLVYQMQK